jgi:hypothetical protein
MLAIFLRECFGANASYAMCSHIYDHALLDRHAKEARSGHASAAYIHHADAAAVYLLYPGDPARADSHTILPDRDHRTLLGRAMVVLGRMSRSKTDFIGGRRCALGDM